MNERRKKSTVRSAVMDGSTEMVCRSINPTSLAFLGACARARGGHKTGSCK